MGITYYSMSTLRWMKMGVIYYSILTLQIMIIENGCYLLFNSDITDYEKWKGEIFIQIQFGTITDVMQYMD